MAQHRQPEQGAQQTETKLFFMFLFGRIKHLKQAKQKGFKSFIGFGYKKINDKFTRIHVKSPFSLKIREICVR
jgi:hypothetical protein